MSYRAADLRDVVPYFSPRDAADCGSMYAKIRPNIFVRVARRYTLSYFRYISGQKFLRILHTHTARMARIPPCGGPFKVFGPVVVFDTVKVIDLHFSRRDAVPSLRNKAMVLVGLLLPRGYGPVGHQIPQNLAPLDYATRAADAPQAAGSISGIARNWLPNLICAIHNPAYTTGLTTWQA